MKRSLFFLLAFFFSATLLAKLPELIPYRKGNLWGYADSTRKVVIPCQFEEPVFFTGDSVRVKLNGQYGYVQKNGNFRAETVPMVMLAESSVYAVFASNIDWSQRGMLQSFSQGQMYSISQVPIFFISHDLYPAQDQLTGLYGYNANNRRVLYPQYISAGYFSEGLAPVQFTATEWGYIDRMGVARMRFPGTMDNAVSFTNGVALIHLEKGTGLVNKAGQWLVQPGTGEVGQLGECYTVLGSSGTYRLLNKYGNQVGRGFESVEDCGNGLLLVQRGGKYGFISSVSGRAVTAVIYAKARAFRNGLAAVSADGTKWGFVNEAGVLVIPLKYGAPGDFGDNGLCRVSSEGFIDNYGTEYWEE